MCWVLVDWWVGCWLIGGLGGHLVGWWVSGFVGWFVVSW